MDDEKFDVTNMDARVWVKEFMRLYENNKLRLINTPDWVDEDLMIGWFANAIMCGYDNGRVKLKQKLLKRMPKEKEFTFAESEYLSAFSRGEKKGLYFGFNSALSQFKQIVEEVMK